MMILMMKKEVQEDIRKVMNEWFKLNHFNSQDKPMKCSGIVGVHFILGIYYNTLSNLKANFLP